MNMNSKSVDLIYLDPPFNSNTNYAAPIGSEAAGAEFKDTWGLSDIKLAWWEGIRTANKGLYSLISTTGEIAGKSAMSYLIYMSVRLLELKRVLKATGSIYLHCDPTMSHYLKLVMDAIFGIERYQTEITWQRTSAHNDRVFGNVADVILFYGEPSRDYSDNRVPPHTAYFKENYPHSDRFGRYRHDNLTSSKTSASRSERPWRGFDPASYGLLQWHVPKKGDFATYIDEVLAPGYLKIEGTLERLDVLAENGLIHFPESGGLPVLKRYLIPDQGRKRTSVWTDIPPLSKRAKENCGYPTQKPLAILERIIKASTKPGDLVFDPFCGCATTLVAAERLGRQWVGIDLSSKAIDLFFRRIGEERGAFHEITRRDDIPLRTDLGVGHRYSYSKSKKTLYRVQASMCGGCGEHFQLKNLEIDHIVPPSKGGSDHLDNLMLLCGYCNRVKGDRTLEYLKTRLNESKLI